ncbi:hypothetical protein QTP88_006634 [Uroleucon formosanum]
MRIRMNFGDKMMTDRIEYVDTVLHEIHDMRNNMDTTFSKIFKKAKDLIKSVDSEEDIKIPRIVARQKHRINVITNSPEEYYRITIAIPFFDDFIEQLQARNSTLEKKMVKQTRKDQPNSAIEAYIKYNYEYFPNISFLLKLLATLPVSTSTPERTFTMKRLKNYLRNSSGQERLTGLALLSVHRQIHIDPDEVIDRFAKEKKRQIDFVL